MFLGRGLHGIVYRENIDVPHMLVSQSRLLRPHIWAWVYAWGRRAVMCEFPLWFPPYNIRRMRDEDSLMNQLWASTKMTAIENIFREVLCSVSYGHLFCSGLQIGVWNDVWSNDVREQDDARQSGSCSDGERIGNERTIFQVDWLLLCTQIL